MKKNIVLTLLLFCAASLGAQNWEPLFNGKNLKGCFTDRGIPRPAVVDHIPLRLSHNFHGEFAFQRLLPAAAIQRKRIGDFRCIRRCCGGYWLCCFPVEEPAHAQTAFLPACRSPPLRVPFLNRPGTLIPHGTGTVRMPADRRIVNPFAPVSYTHLIESKA